MTQPDFFCEDRYAYTCAVTAPPAHPSPRPTGPSSIHYCPRSALVQSHGASLVATFPSPSRPARPGLPTGSRTPQPPTGDLRTGLGVAPATSHLGSWLYPRPLGRHLSGDGVAQRTRLATLVSATATTPRAAGTSATARGGAGPNTPRPLANGCRGAVTPGQRPRRLLVTVGG
jgi:hypothetical protein